MPPRPTAHKTTKPRAPRKTVAKKPATHPVEHRATVIQKVAKPPHQREYIFSVGRRKEAVARVRWHHQGHEPSQVNGRAVAVYFPTFDLQYLVQSPLVETHNDKQGYYTAKVNGGGIQGQAEAVRLGIARALVKMDADLRLVLKRAGYLRRDPRVKERKKYGLKRARRAPQWQKR